MIWRKILIIPTCLILITALSGCMLFPQEEAVLQPPLRAPSRVEYRTIEVGRGTIVDEIRGFGSVEANVRASVSFRGLAGRLSQLYVSSGDEVEEGDLLAELINDDYIEALERQELITRLAEIDFERVRREPELTRLDREAAQIRLDLSRLDLEKARANVERTRIYAPMTGRVIYVAPFRADDYIAPFSVLVSIADLTQLVLRITGDSATRVPVGSDVTVIINREEHPGTVVQAPALNPEDAIDRNDAIIEVPTLTVEHTRLGAGFQFIYELNRAEDVIVIERSLIRMRAGRTYVLVLENDVPMERNVVIGISTNSYAEILEGLWEGELIIQ